MKITGPFANFDHLRIKTITPQKYFATSPQNVQSLVISGQSLNVMAITPDSSTIAVAEFTGGATNGVLNGVTSIYDFNESTKKWEKNSVVGTNYSSTAYLSSDGLTLIATLSSFPLGGSGSHGRVQMWTRPTKGTSAWTLRSTFYGTASTSSLGTFIVPSPDCSLVYARQYNTPGANGIRLFKRSGNAWNDAGIIAAGSSGEQSGFLLQMDSSNRLFSDYRQTEPTRIDIYSELNKVSQVIPEKWSGSSNTFNRITLSFNASTLLVSQYMNSASSGRILAYSSSDSYTTPTLLPRPTDLTVTNFGDRTSIRVSMDGNTVFGNFVTPADGKNYTWVWQKKNGTWSAPQRLSYSGRPYFELSDKHLISYDSTIKTIYIDRFAD